MPKLAIFRQYHYDATVKVSDNARTLALSAIAIVWLFKEKVGNSYQVPNELFIPLLLVVITMTLDFLQYVYRSIAWHIRFRLDEKQLYKGKITEETELYAPGWINIFAYVLFYGKVSVLIGAYYYLVSYFLSKVNWV